MTEFCLKPETVFALLDEISRHRVLLPHETDILEDIMAMEATASPFRWNPRLETQLLVAAASPGGIARFCRRHGIENHFVAYQKLHRMKQRKGRKIERGKSKVQEAVI